MNQIIKYVLPYLLVLALGVILNQSGLREWTFPLTGSLLVCYYFLIDNPYKYLLIPTSLSFALLLWAPKIDQTAGLSGWFLIGASLLFAVVYLLRTYYRTDRLWIDYLKVVGAIAVVITIHFKNPIGAFAISGLLVYTYLIDRFIIRRQMKKITQIILFTFFSLICISFIIFGQIKASEAVKALNEAQAQAALAEENAAAVERLEKEVLYISQQLENCQNTKD